jgi:hypothetical protein
MDEYKSLVRDSFTANPSQSELWAAPNAVCFVEETSAQAYCQSMGLAAPLKETPQSVAA